MTLTGNDNGATTTFARRSALMRVSILQECLYSAAVAAQAAVDATGLSPGAISTGHLRQQKLAEQIHDHQPLQPAPPWHRLLVVVLHPTDEKRSLRPLDEAAIARALHDVVRRILAARVTESYISR